MIICFPGVHTFLNARPSQYEKAAAGSIMATLGLKNLTSSRDVQTCTFNLSFVMHTLFDVITRYHKFAF